MTNCLVTKLKESVNNSNLPLMNVVRFKYTHTGDSPVTYTIGISQTRTGDRMNAAWYQANVSIKDINGNPLSFEIIGSDGVNSQISVTASTDFIVTCTDKYSIYNIWGTINPTLVVDAEFSYIPRFCLTTEISTTSPTIKIFNSPININSNIELTDNNNSEMFGITCIDVIESKIKNIREIMTAPQNKDRIIRIEIVLNGTTSWFEQFTNLNSLDNFDYGSVISGDVALLGGCSKLGLNSGNLKLMSSNVTGNMADMFDRMVANGRNNGHLDYDLTDCTGITNVSGATLYSGTNYRVSFSSSYTGGWKVLSPSESDATPEA